MRIVFFLLLLISLDTKSATPSWMDLIVAGDDRAAALELKKLIYQLPSTVDKSYYSLLAETAYLLEHGNRVTEESGIYLFRSTNFGDTDMLTKEGVPFFPSKALKNGRKFRPENLYPVDSFFSKKYLKHYEGRIMSELMALHGQSTHNRPTPFISTTIEPDLTGSEMIILRVHPERAFYNSEAKYSREYEYLIPLFIHPSEVVAIIRPHELKERGDILKGEFDIIYKSDKKISDKKIKSLLVSKMRKRKSLFDKSQDINLDFENAQNKKRYKANYSWRRETSKLSNKCSGLFETLDDILNSIYGKRSR